MPQPSPEFLPATLPPSATTWLVPPAFDAAAARAARLSPGKGFSNESGYRFHRSRQHGGYHVTKYCTQQPLRNWPRTVVHALARTEPKKDLDASPEKVPSARHDGHGKPQPRPSGCELLSGNMLPLRFDVAVLFAASDNKTGFACILRILYDRHLFLHVLVTWFLTDGVCSYATVCYWDPWCHASLSLTCCSDGAALPIGCCVLHMYLRMVLWLLSCRFSTNLIALSADLQTNCSVAPLVPCS